MNMELLTAAVSRLPEFEQLCAAMEAGACPVALSGAAAVHRAHMAAGIALKTGRSVVMVCADESESSRMARDLASLTGRQVPVLAARSFTFHRSAAVSHQWEQQRLALMHAMSRGELPVLVVTAEALLQRTLSPETLEGCCARIAVGEQLDLNELSERLTRAGFVRCHQVEGVGQFALRGGILDVYAPGWEQPVRVEFFGDEVDAMGHFDISPSAARRTWRKSPSCPRPRCCPTPPPADWPDWTNSCRSWRPRPPGRG